MASKTLRRDTKRETKDVYPTDLGKPGLLGVDDGKAYDRLFEARQQADYLELVSFEEEETRTLIEDATRLVGMFKRFIDKTDST